MSRWPQSRHKYNRDWPKRRRAGIGLSNPARLIPSRDLIPNAYLSRSDRSDAKGDRQLVCKVCATWVSLLVFLAPIPIGWILVQGQAQTSSLVLDEHWPARKWPGFVLGSALPAAHPSAAIHPLMLLHSFVAWDRVGSATDAHRRRTCCRL